MAEICPIVWKGDSLELLDQRLLPDQLVYLKCRTADEVAAAIRDMVVRGAPAIGCAAAFGVVLGRGSKAAYAALAKSRPTAVNLFWALHRMGAKAKALQAADAAPHAALAARAKAYNMTVEQYKKKNLLRTEVASRDVAELAAEMCGPLFAKTTAAQVPIDGGNERVV